MIIIKNHYKNKNKIISRFIVLLKLWKKLMVWVAVDRYTCTKRP
jgi:hypothetical protein